jgi:hypothetical protein
VIIVKTLSDGGQAGRNSLISAGQWLIAPDNDPGGKSAAKEQRTQRVAGFLLSAISVFFAVKSI